MLGVASGLSALGLARVERQSESRWVVGVSVVFILVALFPTDINAGMTCGDPTYRRFVD